jgi:hypothetical protein
MSLATRPVISGKANDISVFADLSTGSQQERWWAALCTRGWLGVVKFSARRPFPEFLGGPVRACANGGEAMHTGNIITHEQMAVLDFEPWALEQSDEGLCDRWRN